MSNFQLGNSYFRLHRQHVKAALEEVLILTRTHYKYSAWTATSSTLAKANHRADRQTPVPTVLMGNATQDHRGLWLWHAAGGNRRTEGLEAQTPPVWGSYCHRPLQPRETSSWRREEHMTRYTNSPALFKHLNLLV